LDEKNKLVITDYHNDNYEEIDFKDKLIDMVLGFNYLIVVTANQCHIYHINNLSTPYKFDLKDKVKLILTCPKYFALIDDNNSLSVFLIYFYMIYYILMFRFIHMKENQYNLLKFLHPVLECHQ